MNDMKAMLELVDAPLNMKLVPYYYVLSWPALLLSSLLPSYIEMRLIIVPLILILGIKTNP